MDEGAQSPDQIMKELKEPAKKTAVCNLFW